MRGRAGARAPAGDGWWLGAQSGPAPPRSLALQCSLPTPHQTHIRLSSLGGQVPALDGGGGSRKDSIKAKVLLMVMSPVETSQCLTRRLLGPGAGGTQC